MSNATPIEEIGLDDNGYLFVRPETTSDDEYAYIWRDASGITWNSQARALHAVEPARWAALALYQQIVSAAHREYGVKLRITANTEWSRIPTDLRALIESHNTVTAAR